MKKGFGGDTIHKKKSENNILITSKISSNSVWKVKEPMDNSFKKNVELLDSINSNNLEDFFNPTYLMDKDYIKNISEQLHKGNVVIIKNALNPTLAELTYRDLQSTTAPWLHNEEYFENGYHFKHSNIFNRELWTDRLNKTMSIFESDLTKKFIEKLTGRDCTGSVTGAPSYYQAGDHSLPHTDWYNQRTVAYVWHLSKDWRPEWGGALYWCGSVHDYATCHASFNTLVLFSVTTTSSHFVTTVSPHATSKRLAFNGWYQSSWIPKPSDDFKSLLSTPEKRKLLTHTQLQSISDLVNDRFARFESLKKREELKEIKDIIMKEFYPST